MTNECVFLLFKTWYVLLKKQSNTSHDRDLIAHCFIHFKNKKRSYKKNWSYINYRDFSAASFAIFCCLKRTSSSVTIRSALTISDSYIFAVFEYCKLRVRTWWLPFQLSSSVSFCNECLSNCLKAFFGYIARQIILFTHVQSYIFNVFFVLWKGIEIHFRSLFIKKMNLICFIKPLKRKIHTIIHLKI